MKWLFVTADFPWPLAHGTWLHVHHLARSLRQQGDEVAVFDGDGDAEAGRTCYAEAGITLLRRERESPLAMAPYEFEPALARAVAARAGAYDVVLLTHARTLQYAPAAAAAGCVVANFVDDPFLEEWRKLQRRLNPRYWARQLVFLVHQYRYERRFLGSADLVTFVSGQDAASFARRHRRRRVAVARNGVDACFFARPDDLPAPVGEAPTVVFLGNLLHPPNTDAALFLLGEVAPLIWRDEPRAKMVIVGANPPQAVQRLAGEKVEVTAWVDDVRPRLWQATAVVLPMRTGTGIKNKVMEAWAAGAAVVATSLACQGLPARHGDNVLRADTPPALAHAAVSVLRDQQLRGRLGLAGQATARQHLTWSAAATELRRAVRAATASPGRSYPRSAGAACGLG